MSAVGVTLEAVAACRAVSVVYRRGDTVVHALDRVSVEIGDRDRVALLGRSGSGKTTLLHALGGLVEPTDGSVEWRGQPITAVDRAARAGSRAAGIAYVFQAANLLPYFTAFENVAFARNLAAERADAWLTSESLLEVVGLGAKADHLPAELSGGEAQRVAIARALAKRPEVLLCDEPTGHLDTDTGARVLDLLDALQTECGFALVVATHDADVGARYAHELQLEDGSLVDEDERL